MSPVPGPEGHTRKRVVGRGMTAEEADGAVIVIHGRGGSPEGMLSLAEEVSVEGLAWVAPAADRATWYPTSFLAPLEDNEPWLSSALDWLHEIVSELAEKGIPSERVAFVGFSQGACLSAEYVARHPRRFGGVAVLSGGLIGPPDTDFEARFGLQGRKESGAGKGAEVGAGEAVDVDTGEAVEVNEAVEAVEAVEADEAGPLSGTPVFLGCSDVDRHIPEERVRESGRILETLGADVILRIYPGMGHTVNDDELDHVRSLLETLA